MQARIKWVQDTLFIAESGSGHGVVIDGPPEAGGRNLGIRPMEMVLMGMGGCTAFDVVLILRRGHHDVLDCVAELNAERAETEPKVFTHIHVHFIVSGRGLKAAAVKRAIDLSAQKYCSASIMLSKSVSITHDFEIRPVE